MILDKKIKTNSGSISVTFWISGWIKEKENIIKEIKEEIHPFTIHSPINIKYIKGFTGEETQVSVFATTIKEIIVVSEKENKEAIYV